MYSDHRLLEVFTSDIEGSGAAPRQPSNHSRRLRLGHLQHFPHFSFCNHQHHIRIPVDHQLIIARATIVIVVRWIFNYTNTCKFKVGSCFNHVSRNSRVKSQWISLPVQFLTAPPSVYCCPIKNPGLIPEVNVELRLLLTLSPMLVSMEVSGLFVTPTPVKNPPTLFALKQRLLHRSCYKNLKQWKIRSNQHWVPVHPSYYSVAPSSSDLQCQSG